MDNTKELIFSIFTIILIFLTISLDSLVIIIRFIVSIAIFPLTAQIFLFLKLKNHFY